MNLKSFIMNHEHNTRSPEFNIPKRNVNPKLLTVNPYQKNT